MEIPIQPIKITLTVCAGAKIIKYHNLYGEGIEEGLTCYSFS